MDIGKRIKDRRKELGLSAEIVAEKIGVSPATIYRYESAEIMNMGIDKIELIAHALYMGWTDKQSTYEPKKESLINHFDLLNSTGQDKAIDYVSDLADNPKYRLADEVQEEKTPYVPEVLAAHHKTGKLDDEDRDIINNAIQFVGELKKKGE